MADAATVVFHRPPTRWVDRIRDYRLMLDGADVAHIGFGQTLAVPVAPGRHWVQARVDWTGSPRLDFDAPPGAEVHLSVMPRPNPFTVLWFMFGTTRWLRLVQLA